MVTWSAAFPSIEIVFKGSVMSVMVALPLKVALHGAVKLLVAGHGLGLTAREVIELPLIWYTRPLLRTIVFQISPETHWPVPTTGKDPPRTKVAVSRET